MLSKNTENFISVEEAGEICNKVWQEEGLQLEREKHFMEKLFALFSSEYLNFDDVSKFMITEFALNYFKSFTKFVDNLFDKLNDMQVDDKTTLRIRN